MKEIRTTTNSIVEQSLEYMKNEEDFDGQDLVDDYISKTYTYNYKFYIYNFFIFFFVNFSQHSSEIQSDQKSLL